MSSPRKPSAHADPGPEQAAVAEPVPAQPPAKPAAEPPAAAVASLGFPNPDSGQIGPGESGTAEGVPECPVCYARGGGAHGSHCPNAGLDPADWVTEPQAGWARPERRT